MFVAGNRRDDTVDTNASSKSDTPGGVWFLLMVVAVSLFFWKILFTLQYSMLLDYDNANQTFAWTHFAASSLQQGVVPLWNPNVHSGRSFVAEMESGLFYPPKLILYFWPMRGSRLLSLRLLHDFFVINHLLAACFMFLLAREMGLSGFSSLVAGLCFSLGGFVGHIPWLRWLDGSIWLPLIVLFVRRALLSPAMRRALWNAWIAGLVLGLVILAGCLHLAIMDTVVVVSLAVYMATTRGWRLSALVILLVGMGAFLMGAVQLLPSMEYGPMAMRWLGPVPPVPAAQRIPYADLSDGLYSRSLFAFLLGYPFGGRLGSAEFTPYMGVLPLILVVLGIWRSWADGWIRYLTGLGVCAFLFTLGAHSLLHGLAYALVPFLWMAREPSRFVYLLHFAMALLAGFGIRALFSPEMDRPALIRVMSRLALGVTAVLAIPALYEKLEVNEWNYVSLVFLVSAAGMIIYIARGHQSRAVRFVLVALILTDLSAFDWTARNIREESLAGRNSLEVLSKSRPLATFLQSQPGLFRVHFETPSAPNIGDLYGIQTTLGFAATELSDYYLFMKDVPNSLDLLNVRYIIRDRQASQPNPVYQDELWKVYENPTAMPRAWVLPAQQASVRFDHYRLNRIEINVRAQHPSLLVLSENHYPGWKAIVNGQPAPVVKVHGLLRGVSIPAGVSTVVWRFAPRSVAAGGVMTLAALGGTLIALLSASWQRRRRTGLPW